MNNNQIINSNYFESSVSRSYLTDWIEAIHSIISLSSSASAWLLEFLASEEGLKYIKPFLVESSARDVRINFSGLLEKCLSSSCTLSTNTWVETIIRHIVSLLRHVGDNVKHSSQYFWFLFMFAQMVKIPHSFERLFLILIFIPGRVLLSVNNFLISAPFKTVFSFSQVSL